MITFKRPKSAEVQRLWFVEASGPISVTKVISISSSTRASSASFSPILSIYGLLVSKLIPMGFTTSLFSGFTLTSTTLYLTLLYHQRARAHQAALLHQQALLLNSLTDPAVASELATIAEANYSGGFREGVRDYRLEKAPLTERFKDRWNSEVTHGIRWMQNVRWVEVRENMESWVRDRKEG